VPNLNPDGFVTGTRLNGRGVDLNRNFPSGWEPIGQRYDLEYSGPHPFSEPETRLAARLIRLIHPRITVWFHQETEPMVRAWGPSVPAGRRYAELAQLPFRRLPWLAGTAPNWQNHRFPGTSSFVVELPDDALTRSAAYRYANAVRLLAGEVAAHPLELARRPYMGISCKVPNSIACDRVGLAVFIPKRRRAVRVRALIDGREVALHVPSLVPTKGIYFEGFLHHAGLNGGALDVTSGVPVHATVRITAYYRDGSSASTTRKVGLAPGWG
jgi:Zinc carboxypeptidase